MHKDKALRQAKLDYLAQAPPTRKNPLYWGGVVLIGDTTPVMPNKGIGWPWLISFGIVLLMATIGYRFA